MPDSASPLQVIKQKELDLRQRVEGAHQQAEARIQAARLEAEQCIQRADQEGRAEATASYRQEIERTREEARAITTAAGDEAAELRRRAMPRLDAVARHIAELVCAAFDGEGSDHRHEAMPG